jgi:hypothetical protein
MAVMREIRNALMMEAVRASETSVDLYKNTRRYNAEYSHLPIQRLMKLNASFPF